MKALAAWMLAIGAGCTAGSQGGDVSSAPVHIDVRLTDAPATFDSVLVTISKVEVSTDAGWLTLSDHAQRFDLLTLQNDATALLGSADLAPGTYHQLRLIVQEASVVAGGVESVLEVASGAQTGIKVVVDAELEAGTTYTLVLDFDAAKSIQATGDGHRMTPVIRVKSLTAVDGGHGSGCQ